MIFDWTVYKQLEIIDGYRDAYTLFERDIPMNEIQILLQLIVSATDATGTHIQNQLLDSLWILARYPSHF